MADENVISIEIDRPTIAFVMAGDELVKFDFYELEDALEASFKTEDYSTLREWMIGKGLPATVPLSAVTAWVDNYIKAMNKKLKNEIGS